MLFWSCCWILFLSDTCTLKKYKQHQTFLHIIRAVELQISTDVTSVTEAETPERPRCTLRSLTLAAPSTCWEYNEPLEHYYNIFSSYQSIIIIESCLSVVCTDKKNNIWWLISYLLSARAAVGGSKTWLTAPSRMCFKPDLTRSDCSAASTCCITSSVLY